MKQKIKYNGKKAILKINQYLKNTSIEQAEFKD
jgi:hypothetical protein